MSKRQQPPELVAFATALHSAINAIPERDRAYAVNFVSKNAHRPANEMLARLADDLAGREEAAAIQRHRDERVMGEYREVLARRGVEASLTGVAADGVAATTQAKG